VEGGREYYHNHSCNVQPQTQTTSATRTVLLPLRHFARVDGATGASLRHCPGNLSLARREGPHQDRLACYLRAPCPGGERPSREERRGDGEEAEEETHTSAGQISRRDQPPSATAPLLFTLSRPRPLTACPPPPPPCPSPRPLFDPITTGAYLKLIPLPLERFRS
jgi:hypothetical protein